MANMFRTIQRRGGGRGPEWLSDRPDPGNRSEAINREASMLDIRGRADTASAYNPRVRVWRTCRLRPRPSRCRARSKAVRVKADR